ncbi:LPXTG cell wall anchor domain-containing protein [bacterium]|nr:LPXTG cell wall anchor domain-containing protein [bacterium]
MKRNIIWTMFIAILLVMNSLANLPDDPVAYAKWEADLFAAINAQANVPPEQAIPKLAGWVVRLSQERTPNWEKGDRPVFHAAQSALLAIPGHAHYFEQAVKELQSKLESAPKDEKWNYVNDYSRLQWDAFQTLGQLPSLETVRVLGGFLYDDSGGLNLKDGDPIPTEGEIMSQQKKNRDGAVMALFQLIENPPMKAVGTPQGNAVEVWRLWYEQVKAGNRTFRFKGNLTEYDLDGPAPKEKLQRVERDRKRDKERSTGHRESPPATESAPATGQTGKSSAIAWLIAGIGLIGGGAWYFLRGRKTA